MTVEWNDSGVPDHMPQGGELTGYRRYVRTPLGLVLQVEYSVFMRMGKWCNLWRDAVPDDVIPSETVI